MEDDVSYDLNSWFIRVFHIQMNHNAKLSQFEKGLLPT